MESQATPPIVSPDIQPPSTSVPPGIQKPAGQKDKSSKYIVLIIVSLLLVLVVIAGTYAYRNYVQKNKESLLPQPTTVPSITIPSPAQNPTADWQTYINKELNIEFKYPKNFLLRGEPLELKSEDNFSPYDIFLINNRYEKQGQPPGIYLAVVNTQKTAQDFIDFDYQNQLNNWNKHQQESDTYKGQPGPKIDNIASLKINNLDVIKVERYNGPSAPYANPVQYYLKNQNNIFVFTATCCTLNPDTGESGENEKQILDQILSTFTFSNIWKTYNSLGNIYTFLYPPNWVLHETNLALGTGASVSSPEPNNKTTSEDVYTFDVGYVVYKSIPEYIRSLENLQSKHPGSISDYQTIKLGNREAVRAIFPGSEQAVTMIKTFVVDRNQGYELTYGCRKDFTKLDQIANITPDILSTFKFLE